jgi:hypothetical protein
VKEKAHEFVLVEQKDHTAAHFFPSNVNGTHLKLPQRLLHCGPTLTHTVGPEYVGPGGISAHVTWSSYMAAAVDVKVAVAAAPVPPPPVRVTIGGFATEYPLPFVLTVILETVPAAPPDPNEAVAVACTPPAIVGAEIVTVGAVEYPDPAVVTDMALTCCELHTVYVAKSPPTPQLIEADASVYRESLGHTW